MMETDDVIELTRLVAVGLAVALLPPSIAAGAELRTVPIRHYVPIHKIALATSSVRQPSAATQALLDTVHAKRTRDLDQPGEA
jgi:DNA-binding transcriptional LysR family regulator